jgi:YHS domain-containing protein
MGRIFLYLLFFYVFFYVVKLLLKILFGPRRGIGTDAEPEELVQDPYCLTYISKRVALKKRVSGKDVYFCREECLRKYLADRRTSEI